MTLLYLLLPVSKLEHLDGDHLTACVARNEKPLHTYIVSLADTRRELFSATEIIVSCGFLSPHITRVYAH